ncbi:MAG: TraM recognition domain-containing protein [Planctomycetaceae bacterium]|nr:TraM recognition domain-containing protein [Planctomycetaceae bacterium]
MTNATDLLIMARGTLSVSDLYRLVTSAATSKEQWKSDEWRKSSFCFRCLREADAKRKTPVQEADFELVADYFAIEWVNLSDRTRSNILTMFTSMLDKLNRGIIRELISSPVTNVTPEMCQAGKLLLIDVPLKVWGEAGLLIQVLWKHCLQRAQERRNVQDNPRPVFLAVDESHLLTTSADQLFQTTARSTRTAVIYATQNISNYLAALGDKAEPEVHSLLGNLQTQIFHQQADIKTNSYAAELIGRTHQFLINANSSREPSDLFGSMFGQSPSQCTAGVNETIDFEVQPATFATLRKGGPPHWVADAIVYQGGRRFHATGRPYMSVTFRQHL